MTEHLSFEKVASPIKTVLNAAGALFVQ